MGRSAFAGITAVPRTKPFWPKGCCGLDECNPWVFWAAFTHANVNRTAWEDDLVKDSMLQRLKGSNGLYFQGPYVVVLTICALQSQQVFQIFMVVLTSLASPASPRDQGSALRHRLSPHSLLIQFAMPCCKEVESNSANEACFYKIHGCYLLQIYLFQWCSTIGL